MRSLAPNPKAGFLLVALALCALINLFYSLDMIFLWHDAGFFRWDISNPDASRLLLAWSGLHTLFFFVFPGYLVYLLLKGEREVLHLASLLGWFLLAIGVAFGLLSQMGRQFHVDFYIHVGMGLLILFGVGMMKKR